jgi:UDP-N-acetylmuramyl pentapeptide phosphotransferase/UDP-N-acetylglucosamine-1-phosphate transferase
MMLKSLPDSLRMAVQIISILLMFWSMGLYTAADSWLWTAVIVVVALFFCVGATNFINFMDGINGITAAYSFAMLLPILLMNRGLGFIEESYLIVAILGLSYSASSTSGPRARRSALPGMWEALVSRLSSCLRWEG